MDLLPVEAYQRLLDQAHDCLQYGQTKEAERLYLLVVGQIQTAGKAKARHDNLITIGIGAAVGWLIGGFAGGCCGAAIAGWNCREHRLHVESAYEPLLLDAIEGLVQCERRR